MRLAHSALAAGLSMALAFGQGDAPVLEATASLRTYLALHPYHERVFDDLVRVGEHAGGLDALVAFYAGRAGEERSAHILLARLLDHRGDTERARELLANETDPSRDTWLLRARLNERVGDLERALVLFGQALGASEDDDERGEVLLALARLRQWTADDAGARAALVELATLVPDTVADRMDVAERMAALGFARDAEVQYRRAVELAAGDGARRSLALTSLGRLLEAQREGALALDAYDEAMTLLSHGHWLRTELFERVLELRATAGTLDEWLVTLRVDAQGSALVAPRLDLAAVLARDGQPSAAVDVLLAARTELPPDDALDRSLLDVARSAHRKGVVVEVLQDRARAAPHDPLAPLELAEALWGSGAADAAERAVHRAEELARDARELRAVAAGWRGIERTDEAARVLEQAAASAPDDVGALLDCAHLAAETGDEGGRRAALERAEQRASGSTSFAVADAWIECGEPARARALLERAATTDARVEALGRLAALLVELEDEGAARTTLLALAREVEGVQRSEALAELAGTLTDAERSEWLAAHANAAADTVQLLANAHVAERVDPARAVELYRAYAERVPDDMRARRDLVDALDRAGRLDEAVATLEQLAQVERAERATHLLHAADLLRRARRTEPALAKLAQVRQLAHRTPELLRKLATRYGALRRPGFAINALEQALRLDPDDTASARQLAQLLLKRRRSPEAYERLLTAWRHANAETQRHEIAIEMDAALEDPDLRDRELAALFERARSDPYDREAPALLAELLARERRYSELHDLAEMLLERQPSSERWKLVHVQAELGVGRLEPVLTYVERRCAAGDTVEAVLETLLEPLMHSPNRKAGSALGRLADEPADLVRKIVSSGYGWVAARFVEGHVAANGLGAEGVLDLVLELTSSIDDDALKLRAYRALEQRNGTSLVLVHRIGRLHAAAGDELAALARGRQLIRLGGPRKLVERYFAHSGLADHLTRERAFVACERLLGHVARHATGAAPPGTLIAAGLGCRIGASSSWSALR
ncbi:MAG: tetratricopeptide repeat protein [bacterium]|nr:tetratricopeptide repeat protein [bacterium]